MRRSNPLTSFGKLLVLGAVVAGVTASAAMAIPVVDPQDSGTRHHRGAGLRPPDSRTRRRRRTLPRPPGSGRRRALAGSHTPTVAARPRPTSSSATRRRIRAARACRRLRRRAPPGRRTPSDTALAVRDGSASTVKSDGFDWNDWAIGIGSGLGLALLACSASPPAASGRQLRHARADRPRVASAERTGGPPAGSVRMAARSPGECVGFRRMSRRPLRRAAATACAEIRDLAKLGAIAAWDQQTMMPAAGAEVRARQLATSPRSCTSGSSRSRLGELLDELRPYEESLDYESDEASLIRVTRRDRDKELRVPASCASADASRGGGIPGLGRGAPHERLRALPPEPRAERRPPARVRGLLRGGRAVRRAARRLRAGDEDGRGARGVRPTARRARPDRRRGVGAGRSTTRASAATSRSMPSGRCRGCCSRGSASARTPGGSTRSSTRSRRRSARRTSG